ncbi:oligosaccharide flippase family protein [Brevundimonas variabilis]|uniref:O-antigen/teichoic acid export membrane protein n=1 Tax=Brevundimonas variabilis TaxID=74312 RepID=A0A7W9CJI1_9CAUL|nr:oligosaccharide flippase family protein [Brevundimonas variabilis]MBB5746327.1 O-antigen/teichoic acid export membrane protein [Brevundimonas variabilis]
MSVRKALAWAFSAQFVTFTAGFIGSIAIARLLGPAEMGVYAVAVAVVGVLGIFATFGVSSYVTKEVDLTEDKLASAFTVNALINVMMAMLLFAGSFVVPELMRSDDVGPLLRLLAIQPLIGLFDFRPMAMMQRHMKFGKLAYISAPLAVAGLVISVTLASRGFSFYSMAYAALATSTAGMIAANVLGREYVSLRLSLTHWRELSSFGLKIMSVSGVAQGAQRISDLVLARVLGIEALGIFSRASNLSNMIFFNLYGTATRVAFVNLSEEFRKTGELGPVFLRSLELIMGVMWPLLAGIAVLSGPMIYILYGEQWLAAALPLSILMIAQCIALCFGMNWELFVLRGEVGRQSKYEIIRSVLGTLAFAFGSIFGLVTAALGRVVETLIGLFLYYPHVQRLARVRPSQVSAVYQKSAALTFVAVGPSFVLMAACGWSPSTPIWSILVAVGIGVAGWILLLRKVGHPIYGEFERVYSRFRHGAR